MILTAAEKQLIHIIRAAHRHDLTLTVRVREGHYTVRITTYDAGPGVGIGYGDSFDAARHDVTELHAQRAG
jgi:ribosomal protein S5